MSVISYAPLSPAERLQRRRVLFTDYNSPRYKAKAMPVPEPLAEPVPVVAEPRKGVCRHCGAHVGRGIRWHEKKCRG